MLHKKGVEMIRSLAAAAFRSVSSLALAAAAWAVAAPAHAQSELPADETQEDGARSNDIVVTASKRSERLLDVPGAVSAIEAEDLIESQRVSIVDFYPQVPGLTVSDMGNGRTSLAIRGVTTGNTQRATVGIVIDDIPFTSTGGTNVSPNLTPDLDPAILQRIEVLRGPQGTLYGAATVGGLLKYVTVTPSIDGIRGFAQADLSTIEQGEAGYSLRGSVNAALVPGELGMSASMFFRHEPGFVDDSVRGLTDVNRIDIYGGRLELRWKPSDIVQVRLGALTQISQSGGQSTIRTNYALVPFSANYDFNAFPTTGDRKSQMQFYTGIVDVDLGDVAITSLSGYLHNSFVNDFAGTLNQFPASTALFGVNGNYIKNIYKIDKFSQELRVYSTGDALFEWMLGAFYTTEDSYSLQIGYAIDPATGRTPGTFFEFWFPGTFEEKAAFGDLKLNVTDRLTLQAGARYSKNNQTYYEEDRGPRYVPPIIFYKESSDTAFTYSGSIRYEFLDDVMAYARVASGYRPGGPQTAAFGPVVPPQVDPDSTVNYELGLKGQLLDRAISFDVAGFRIDWDDIQLSQTLPGYGFFYINGGKAKIQGVEGSVQISPFQGTLFSANATYTDSQLRTPPIGFVGAVGDRLPWSAEWQWNASLDQDFKLGGTIDAFANATVSFVGDRWGTFPTAATNVRQYMPSYTTLDARIGVRLDSRYTLMIYGKNLTDELGFLSSSVIQGSANTVSAYATSIIRPRVIGVSLSGKF